MRLLIALLAAMVAAGTASAQAWTPGASEQQSLQQTQSVQAYSFTDQTDSDYLDVSSCVTTERTFDPSTGDASTDARYALYQCPTNSSNYGQCTLRDDANDDSVWEPIGISQPFVRVRVLSPPVGGDTAQFQLRCTTDPAFAAGGGGGSGDVTGPNGAGSGNVPVFADTTGKVLADSGSAPVILPTGSATSPYLTDVDGDGTYETNELVLPINPFSLTDGALHKAQTGDNASYQVGTGASPTFLAEITSTADCSALITTGTNRRIVCIDLANNIWFGIVGTPATGMQVFTSADCTAENVSIRGMCEDGTGLYFNASGTWEGPK